MLSSTPIYPFDDADSLPTILSTDQWSLPIDDRPCHVIDLTTEEPRGCIDRLEECLILLTKGLQQCLFTLNRPKIVHRRFGDRAASSDEHRTPVGLYAGRSPA